MLKVLTIVPFLLVAACGNETQSTQKGDHVWKTQTDALDKARAAADAMNKEAAERAQRLEQQEGQ